MSSGAPDAERDEKETGRIEAFSDGVFAIAITLLVLDLKVPHSSELPPNISLISALLKQWPTFLAYVISFATILVMWVNHHRLFNHIRRSSHTFLFLNGLLLFFVTFVPFPTALLAEYIRHPEAKAAAAVYAGTYFAIAISFTLLWRYAAGRGQLLDARADLSQVEAITKQYRYGPPLYLLSFLLAFVYVPASVGMCLVLAIFFAFKSPSEQIFAPQSGEDGRIKP